MRKTLICILLLLAAMNIFAQAYTYDSASNRTGRVIALKASPVQNGKESVTALPDLIAEKAIVIYPNPTKGMLTVEIKDYSDQMQAEFRLTDMSGKTISNKKATSAYQTFDLSRQAMGIYLLQIRINGESVVWKIIKE
jgi:hypothetical protein